MLEFIEVANAIRVLYQYVKEPLTESDFWVLTAEQYQSLSHDEEKNGAIFMINPGKLSSSDSVAFVVDEREKVYLQRAVKYIERVSSELPQTASFLERLLFAKKGLPPILFSNKDREQLSRS